MQLPTPVTIRLPSGMIDTRDTFHLVLVDNESNKTVTAMMFPAIRRFTLWTGEGYDAAGDWTQSQAVARLLEVLGPSPADSLTAVGFPTPEQVPAN